MNKYIRQICRFWKFYPSRFVKINPRKIDHLVNQLSKQVLKTPSWHNPGILPESPYAFVSHSFYVCAIDFAFRHFQPPHEKFVLNDQLSGSTAATACFYRRFGENPIWPYQILEIVATREKTADFFRGVNLPPLLEERRACLEEAARVMKREFDGSPFELLNAAQYRVSRLIDIFLTRFPLSFGSDCYYVKSPETNSLKLFFAIKRAQLWPLIYQGRATHTKPIWLKKLRDPQNIGPVADYQIPKFLRAIGVLKYTAELDEKIAKQQILVYGSPEEMEIRFATIYVVNEIMKKAGLQMPALDYFLWTAGQKVTNLNHHLTPTTAY